jgi:hypothetical protein
MHHANKAGPQARLCIFFCDLYELCLQCGVAMNGLVH